MCSPIRAIIDTAALRNNLRRVRECAPASKVMAVVKANAYGHGLIAAAQALFDADAYAVARLEEGLTLRAAGVTKPIVLLEGVFSQEELREAARHGFDLVVHDLLQIELLENFIGKQRFVLLLKIDTGMNRLGFTEADFPVALRRLQQLQPSPLELRLITHLACADEREQRATKAQLSQFDRLVGKLNYPTSFANSAGVFRAIQDPGEWVRPGLALYGASPFADQIGSELDLLPAMTLSSAVIATRPVKRGQSVGYGNSWTAPRNSTIAIVAAGYGDGLPRGLPNGTPVLIDGRRAPLVGRVSMDMLSVDITDLPAVHVGTPVLFWGEQLPVEEIARYAATIPYELLCSITQRVPRILKAT